MDKLTTREAVRTPLPLPSAPIAAICGEYVRLECKARESERESEPEYAEIFRSGARFLYDLAPADARPWLDTIKRVFEIDSTTTNPGVVLLRASVVA